MKFLTFSVALLVGATAAFAEWKQGWYHINTESKEPLRLVTKPNNPGSGIVVIGTQLAMMLTCFKHDDAGWSVYYPDLPEEKLIENKKIELVDVNDERVRFSGEKKLMFHLEKKEGVFMATFLGDQNGNGAGHVPVAIFEFAWSPLSSEFSDIYGANDPQPDGRINSESLRSSP